MSDPATRATRLAANTAALAVVVYAVLWALTTQVADVRALSPFADDPWDAVATYAAIFLPFVAGPTWIRSFRHRGPVLASSTARRIRWGASVAAAIVLLASLVDAQAIVVTEPDAGSGLPGSIDALILAAIGTAAVALALDARAAVIARRSPVEPEIEPEPDIVDDLIWLASDVARPLGSRATVDRIAGQVQRFFETSPASPRRHRVGFGVVIALGAAITFDAWDAIREGPWADAWVPIVFGTLIATGVLAIYLGTVVPLRLLRPTRPSSS